MNYPIRLLEKELEVLVNLKNDPYSNKIGIARDIKELEQALEVLDPFKVTMKDEVESMFLRFCGNIGIDIPNNYEDIVQFIYEDILATRCERDNSWTSGDFDIAFRRFLESKQEREDNGYGVFLMYQIAKGKLFNEDLEYDLAYEESNYLYKVFLKSGEYRDTRLSEYDAIARFIREYKSKNNIRI